MYKWNESSSSLHFTYLHSVLETECVCSVLYVYIVVHRVPCTPSVFASLWKVVANRYVDMYIASYAKNYCQRIWRRQTCTNYDGSEMWNVNIRRHGTRVSAPSILTEKFKLLLAPCLQPTQLSAPSFIVVERQGLLVWQCVSCYIATWLLHNYFFVSSANYRYNNY